LSNAIANPAHYSALAIIPARGGSKGIPRKNVRDLCGKPLLAWSIEAAIVARSVDRVIVSSDDEEILETARKYGAEGFKRPDYLATDTAATDAVLGQVLRVLKPEDVPELVVTLQPTVPVRRDGLIDECVSRLLRMGACSIFTARPLSYVWWREDKSEWAEYAEWHTNNPKRLRRQDLPEHCLRWEEDGAVYVTRSYLLMSPKNEHKQPRRIGGNVQVYPNGPSIDIDTEEQWAAAEGMKRMQLVTDAMRQTDR